MTIAEFNEAYYFHDSILEALRYAGTELRLHCCFCEFMQKDYAKGQDANSDIVVIFSNASYKLIGEAALTDASFVEQNAFGNTIDFLIEQDPHKYAHLLIEANDVKIIKLRSYCL